MGFLNRVSPPPAPRVKLTFRCEIPVENAGPSVPRSPKGRVPKEGLLIGAGSFRIDTEKALETLQRFQLAAPEDFLLPWLRCAVAGKAKMISVRSRGGELEMRFSGNPLEAAQVQDPLASLIGDEDGGRGRHLAYGLLAALRLNPHGILIESGRGEGRHRLSAGEISTAKTGGTETILRVSWGKFNSELPTRVLDRLAQSAGFHGAKLTIGGRVIDNFPSFEKRAPLVGGKDGMRVLYPALPNAKTSLIGLYILGVCAAVIERELEAPAQVYALLRDDRLALNLSQSGVVEGPVLDELIADLAVAVRALVEKALRDWKTPGQAQWLRAVVRHAVADHGGNHGPGVDPFTRLIWEAEVFKSRRGDKLCLRRVAELVNIWGYEIVLGSDKTFPAFHIDAESLEFLRGVFRP